jgi:hypothetical protein
MTYHADSYRSGKKRISMSLRKQDGGSLIEFAIIAPILFVILFGIIEFGILLYDKAMITNASREGARAGIVYANPRVSYADIELVVRNYCEAHLISFGPGSVLDIDPQRSGDEAGDILTVTVEYPFHFLVFSNVLALIGGSAGNLVNLSAETVMRLE